MHALEKGAGVPSRQHGYCNPKAYANLTFEDLGGRPGRLSPSCFVGGGRARVTSQPLGPWAKSEVHT
eukprot:853413-Prymnesium_polylepis.1